MSDGVTNCSWRAWNGRQTLGQKTGGTGNKGKNRDHLDFSIVKIDLNTEKSPADQKRLAITQISVKDRQLELWENLTRVK